MQNNLISKFDVALTTRVFLSGLGYTEYKSIFSQLFHSDFIISRSSFFRIQYFFLIPTIKKVFFKEQEKLIEKIRENSDTVVLTDGRFSRPQRKKGAARYCTDVVIEEKSKCVVAIDTMSKLQVVKNEEFPKHIQKLNSQTAWVTKQRPLEKKWEYFCKQRTPLPKELIVDKRKKFSYKYKSILFLSNKIKKHFKITCYLANNEKGFFDRWNNFIEHIGGNHDKCQVFNPNSKCCSPNWDKAPIINKEEKILCYEIFERLQKKVLKNISNYITAKQTSIVETFNSTLNKYCPKHKYFNFENFKARTYLTALVWNFKKIFPFSTTTSIFNEITNKVLNSFIHFDWKKNAINNSSRFEGDEKDYLLFYNFIKKANN
ncbi:hypothetical protein M0813_27707 [Anaeramoeba flamelloides]|uniref:Uncharacterized protein n=1 Tax=Anaeramoeba flamelloides TaxID=1746091 RepID=A0ABQ8XUQ0_9EUKA|nr:hypothetical protein M0813_27707 [Anaeramoeba flamelloides]